MALERRPELGALEAEHEAALNAWRAARSSFLPRVNLFVAHEYSTTDSAFRDPDLFSGGVNIGWELFDGFRREARLDELEAGAQQVRARHRQLYTSVLTDVRRAWRRRERAADGVRVAAVVVEHARENLRRVTDLFREGRATGQEVLEAEGLLIGERAKAVRARFQVMRAQAALRFAAGLDFDEQLEEE
jgi:outer membrane protein TolC